MTKKEEERLGKKEVVQEFLDGKPCCSGPCSSDNYGELENITVDRSLEERVAWLEEEVRRLREIVGPMEVIGFHVGKLKKPEMPPNQIFREYAGCLLPVEGESK